MYTNVSTDNIPPITIDVLDDNDNDTVPSVTQELMLLFAE